MEMILPIFALTISIGTLIWTVWFNIRQNESNALVSSLVSFIEVEQKLGDIPSALKFHGVDPDELKSIGITPQEFSYLLSSFTAGGIYYRIKEKTGDEPYLKESYRYNILKSPKTQKAWPLLEKFLEPSPYKDKIEATIKYIKENETS